MEDLLIGLHLQFTRNHIFGGVKHINSSSSSSSEAPYYLGKKWCTRSLYRIVAHVQTVMNAEECPTRAQHDLLEEYAAASCSGVVGYPLLAPPLIFNEGRGNCRKLVTITTE